MTSGPGEKEAIPPGGEQDKEAQDARTSAAEKGGTIKETDSATGEREEGNAGHEPAEALEEDAGPAKDGTEPRSAGGEGEEGEKPDSTSGTAQAAEVDAGPAPVEADSTPGGEGEDGAGVKAALVSEVDAGPTAEESGSTPGDGDEAEAGAEAAGVSEDSAGPAEEEAAAAEGDAQASLEGKKRRRLALVLLLLLTALVCVSITFWRYVRQRAPLPDLLPIAARVNYPPHYLFSIYGIDRPVGVALSPQGDRIYVSETGGQRLVKIFDRNGGVLGSFAAPHTSPAERSPVYLAVDGDGQVYVTDRLQHSVFLFDREGHCLDALLGPDLTLSEYVDEQDTGTQPIAGLAYNQFDSAVYCQTMGGEMEVMPAPAPARWAPLGIRVDGRGDLWLTDVFGDRHAVHQIPGSALAVAARRDFDPAGTSFGRAGQNDGELMFPNAAVVDSLYRIYVTDGNNGRVSVWDGSGTFLFHFGQGTGEGALSLPRGAALDGRDRLHIVDAVEQKVKVYDVSGSEPEFLFAFGTWGIEDGQFNFPNDIALDDTGRLYIADRENNRIQVWSY